MDVTSPVVAKSNNINNQKIKIEIVLFFSADVEKSTKIVRGGIKKIKKLIQELVPENYIKRKSKRSKIIELNPLNLGEVQDRNFCSIFFGKLKKNHLLCKKSSLWRVYGDEVILCTNKVDALYQYTGSDSEEKEIIVADESNKKNTQVNQKRKYIISIEDDQKKLVTEIIQCYIDSLLIWNKVSKSIENKTKDDIPSYLKGCIWSAHMLKNTDSSNLHIDDSDEENEKLPEALSNLELKYEQKGAAPIRDFMGSSIHYGFRLREYAKTDQMIIDANTIRDFLIDSQESALKRLKCLGFGNMKGFDLMNPVFAVDIPYKGLVSDNKNVKLTSKDFSKILDAPRHQSLGSI